MFLLAPLLFILVSALGIAIIVWRKRTYLNKIYAINNAGSETDAAVSSGSGFSWMSYGEEFFPEIKTLLDRVKFNEYKTMWLMETEKTLRKIRVIFLRVDRLSDTLIKKIRRININNQLNGHDAVNSEPAVMPSISKTSPAVKNEKISIAFLKNEEERLIIEIAKNPKDPQLYEKLGDLYLEMDNFNDAKESYEAAIELSPQNETLKIKLSSALEKVTIKN